MRIFSFYLTLLVACTMNCVYADEKAPERETVLAVTQAMLNAINRDDREAMAALFLDDGLFISIRMQEGERVYKVTDKAAIRSGKSSVKLLERGFNPEVRISGDMAMVWLPYDIYINDKWSHCGVDLVTMLKVAEGWKLTTFQYSVLQPPACEVHPDGEPKLN